MKTVSRFSSKYQYISRTVCVFFSLVGYPPFADRPNKTLTQQVIEGSYSFPDKYWKDISSEAKDMIRKLMTVDPTKRITVAQALDHPWMKVRTVNSKLDWSDNLAALFEAKLIFNRPLSPLLLYLLARLTPFFWECTEI